MKVCPNCQKDAGYNKVCPICGTQTKDDFLSKFIKAIVAFLIFLSLIASLITSCSSKTNSKRSSNSYNYGSYDSNKHSSTAPGVYYDENGNGKLDNGEFAIGDNDVYVYADGDFYEWG